MVVPEHVHSLGDACKMSSSYNALLMLLKAMWLQDGMTTAHILDKTFSCRLDVIQHIQHAQNMLLVAI